MHSNLTTYNIAATQHPIAASVFFSWGISISLLPAPHKSAMYTSTGIATADITVHTDAQQDLNPSEAINFFPREPMGFHVPIVVGSYAKVVKPGVDEAQPPIFQWTCGVYPAGYPRSDLTPIIERVVFTLHKSFANVRTRRLLFHI